MENKRSRKRAAKIVLCILIAIGIYLLCAHHYTKYIERVANQIQTKCKAILTVEYSNAPEYNKAQIQLAEAKDLLNSNHFHDESIKVFVHRAEKHLASLPENPLLNYNLEELNEVIKSTIADAPGNWSVYFEIPDTEFAVEINNKPVNAASTIKLFNMITLYDELKKDRIEMTPTLKMQLEAMVTVSSNTDSNAVVTSIGNGNFFTGAEKVTVLAHALGAKDTQEEHMLYDEKTITPGRNITSVRDCATVLRLLYKGECVSPQADAEMINILKRQTRSFKLPLYLPDEAEIAHKTGENNDVELDVGIIYSPKCDYILCVSVTDWNGAPVRNTFGRINEAIYNYLNK